MLHLSGWARVPLFFAVLGLGLVAACVDDASSGHAEPSASPLVSAVPYKVTTPSKYDANVATPLVVLLHGYAQTSTVIDDYFKLSALADEKNFLVALPEGTRDGFSNQFWNATDACCDFTQTGVDHVTYLKAVIADMKARFNVDAKRVYVVGHSNGGFMAHRLACELSTEIAGIVSLAGALDADLAKCKATEPVAVLQVHGDADEIVAYGGGAIVAGGKPVPSAKTTIAMWASKNGCADALTPTGETLDLDTGLAGAETAIARHACTIGAAELWTIAGGKHIPTFGTDWAPRLYAFLEAHPKP